MPQGIHDAASRLWSVSPEGAGASARGGKSGPTPAFRRSRISRKLRTKYKFDDRGNDTFVRVSWDEVFKYVADGLSAIASTYSGDEGAARLQKDGYEQLMIDQVQGAGTRTIKIGSNLPIHGVVGKFGIYRFANLLGLVDHHVRGVPPEKARGARDWNEYTWRGDQAPGHPFVHGLQTSDMDFNDLRFSKLVIQIGKNLIENKMPESHWLNEVMERGGKLVDIAPEYNCPAPSRTTGSAVRPGLSDTAVLLGVTKILHRQQVVQARLLPPVHRFSAAGPHRHAGPVATAGRSGRLPARKTFRPARRTRSKA